jgi:hypothetical protein
MMRARYGVRMQPLEEQHTVSREYWAQGGPELEGVGAGPARQSSRPRAGQSSSNVSAGRRALPKSPSEPKRKGLRVLLLTLAQPNGTM